jgi:DNA repair protein RadD
MNELIARPPLNTADVQPLPEWLELRHIQQVMFDNLIKSYRNGKRKQVLVAPTGSGKTIWTAVLFQRILSKNPKSRLLFVVPRNTLLNQTVEVFKEILQLPVSIIQGQNEGINLRYNIAVATIQTLGNRIDKYPELFNGYDCCVIDEGHLTFKARSKIESDWIIALTATPYAKGMGLFYDDLVRSIPAHQLVKEGVITPLKVLSAKKQIDVSKLSKTSTGEYNSDEEEKAVFTLIGDVLKEYEANPEMKDRPFIGFAKTIKACVALTELFDKAGHKVSYVHSKMSDEDNEAILDSFKRGHLIGVFSVVKLTEGFDFVGASALLLCTAFADGKDGRPNALARWAQMHGRIRRADPDNPNKVGLVHDHGGNWTRFAHPDVYEVEFDQLCDGKKKEVDSEAKESDVKLKECPECGYFVKGRFCQECGHELKKYSEFVNGEVVEFEDGKMVEIIQHDIKENNPNKHYTPEDKRIFFGSLKGYGLKHGYAKGWAANQYRNKFQVWPNAYKDAPAIEPTKEVLSFIRAEKIAYRSRQASLNRASV